MNLRTHFRRAHATVDAWVGEYEMREGRAIPTLLAYQLERGGMNAYDRLEERRRAGSDLRRADGARRLGAVGTVANVAATRMDGPPMNWLLRWWQRLPSWAAIIIGLFAVSMVAAAVVVGAAMVSAYLLTRPWFWVLLAVAVALYLAALWISNREDEE